MSVKATVQKQLQCKADQAAKGSLQDAAIPSEGWIAFMRKALGISGAQLARLMGLSRSRISQAEKAELEGGVTLRTMQDAAEAMGCKFVYGIVPANGGVRDLIAARARKKAEALVGRTSTHMALEKQNLSAAQIAEEIEQTAQDLMRNPPPDFWED